MSTLTKVRAGWYETTPVPEVGTCALYVNEESRLWEISQYHLSEVDGGLDLTGTGLVAGTLAAARELLPYVGA